MKPQIQDNTNPPFMSSLLAPTLTTRSPHRLPSIVTLALRNLAVRLMLLLVLGATWGTNTSPSVKVKAITHRHVQMLVMLKQHTIVNIRQRMVASCHAYVYLPCQIEGFLYLNTFRCFSIPTSFRRILYHKVFIVPCTMRPGIPHMVRTMDSTVDLIGIRSRNLTAIARRKFTLSFFSCVGLRTM